MKPIPNNREIRVTVLFTQEERDEIQAAAQRSGLKDSTYVRMKALEAARVSER